jgi:hypothetical protein
MPDTNHKSRTVASSMHLPLLLSTCSWYSSLLAHRPHTCASQPNTAEALDLSCALAPSTRSSRSSTLPAMRGSESGQVKS